MPCPLPGESCMVPVPLCAPDCCAGGSWSDAALKGHISRLSGAVAPAAGRNFGRWPMSQISPNTRFVQLPANKGSWDGEVGCQRHRSEGRHPYYYCMCKRTTAHSHIIITCTPRPVGWPVKQWALQQVPSAEMHMSDMI